MSSFALGEIVLSTQGHDKEQFYVVVAVGEDKIAVCDGKFKFLKKPKQKNPSHLAHTGYTDSEIATKLTEKLKINDQMIYHAIVKVKKLVKEDLYGK